ncbi:MAG: M16 family metallopeptidase [Candidatus Nanopelagicaceae bacterium]
MINRTTLDCGLRIITDTDATVRSASVGYFVNIGSRDEAPAEAGASHFLEHVLFKGTSRRSAKEISSSIENLGGGINAYTTNEFTSFYAKVVDEDLPLAVDVLSDVITSAVVTNEEFETERNVVFQEMAMRDDDPQDCAEEAFGSAFWGEHPLGVSILGTKESMNAITRDQIFNYYKRHYKPEAMVVSAAGNINHDKFVDLVKQNLLRDNFLTGSSAAKSRDYSSFTPKPKARVNIHNGNFEQTNLFLGLEGVGRKDPRSTALKVLTIAIGSGMSSRLFQEIREKRGLVYSVDGLVRRYVGSGYFAIYAGCAPDKATEVIKVAREILNDVASNGITDEEFNRGKNAVRAGVLLAGEDSAYRMDRIGSSEIWDGYAKSPDEMMSDLNLVTKEEVEEIARQFFTRPLTLGLAGPHSNEADAKRFEELLK